MKMIMPVAVGFALILGGAAMAQTAAGSASPPTGAPTISSPNGTAAPLPGQVVPPSTAGSGRTPDAMVPLPVTPMPMTSGVVSPGSSAAPAAVTTTAAPSRTTAAPVEGANSFTEGQARSRIEERGYAQVTDLKMDDKGVWRGQAMKDGKTSMVALDYQGNIVAQ